MDEVCHFYFLYQNNSLEFKVFFSAPGFAFAEICGRDGSENPFVTKEQKIAANSPPGRPNKWLYLLLFALYF